MTAPDPRPAQYRVLATDLRLQISRAPLWFRKAPRIRRVLEAVDQHIAAGRYWQALVRMNLLLVALKRADRRHAQLQRVRRGLRVAGRMAGWLLVALGALLLYSMIWPMDP